MIRNTLSISVKFKGNIKNNTQGLPTLKGRAFPKVFWIPFRAVATETGVDRTAWMAAETACSSSCPLQNSTAKSMEKEKGRINKRTMGDPSIYPPIVYPSIFIHPPIHLPIIYPSVHHPSTHPFIQPSIHIITQKMEKHVEDAKVCLLKQGVAVS